jgi:hypothetical protein
MDAVALASQTFFFVLICTYLLRCAEKDFQNLSDTFIRLNQNQDMLTDVARFPPQIQCKSIDPFSNYLIHMRTDFNGHYTWV